MSAPQSNREKVKALIKKASTEAKSGRKDLAATTLAGGTIKIMKEALARKKKTTIPNAEPRVDVPQQRKDQAAPGGQLSGGFTQNHPERAVQVEHPVPDGIKQGQPEQAVKEARPGPS